MKTLSSRLTVAGRLLLAATSLVVLPSTVRAQVASVSADTVVRRNSPAVNFGSQGSLNVNDQSSALLKFDLSTLPPGVSAADVQRATLTIFVSKLQMSGTLDFSAANQSWSESTVTFNGFNLLLVPFASVPIPTDGFVTVDVTNQVRDWVATPTLNYGVVIQAATAAPDTSVVLDSKENTSTSHPAFLSIVVAASGGGVGPTGPTGPTGPSGPAGVAGPSGPAGVGPTGPSGPAGIAGPSGPSGPAGVSGTTGPSGPAGPAGIAGPTGPSGPAGVAGARGPTGPAGPAGATGPSGPAGVAGVAGPSGPAGLMGFTGPAGPTGPTGPSGPTDHVFGASLINPASPNTFYMSLNGNNAFSTNNPEFTGVAMPISCTFNRLVVSTFGSSGGSDTFTVNLVVNGTDQALACTTSSVTGAVSSCTDAVHTVAVTSGQIVGLKIVQASGTPIVRLGIGARCQ